jgi:hypothetical protein
MSRTTKEHEHLRTYLKITPKTADTLIKAGYTDYKQLADASPELIASQFGQVLKLSKEHVTSYKRAFRRLVWVSTQEDPRKHAEDCKAWSNKALVGRGLWCSNYDQLTGREVDARIRALAAGKIVKNELVDEEVDAKIEKVDTKIKEVDMKIKALTTRKTVKKSSNKRNLRSKVDIPIAEVA